MYCTFSLIKFEMFTYQNTIYKYVLFKFFGFHSFQEYCYCSSLFAIVCYHKLFRILWTIVFPQLKENIRRFILRPYGWYIEKTIFGSHARLLLQTLLLAKSYQILMKSKVEKQKYISKRKKN